MWYSKFYNGLLDHQYVSLGIQYYLLARVGARFPFNPASGNLYHLAFELLIKSYLRKKYSTDKLKSKFGHNLVKLWGEFKSEIVDTKLNKFDSIVKNLDSWERVRYINLKGDKSAQAIEIVTGSAPKEYLEKISNLDFHTHEYFRIYTDDMDELFNVFFTVMQVPTEELLKVPDFVWGKQLYEQDNKYNLLDQKV
ncbi:MAG: hypothetical protein ABIB61_01645 [Candidatus Shapirobacteria bacterium]